MTVPFDVIGLGETMLSLIATDGPLEQATTFFATHGGAETNTLVGLSRLGARTAWVGRLGDDALGRRIERDLRDEGLDLRWVRRDPDRATGVMIRDTDGGLVYRRDHSAASALSPDDLQGVTLHEARAVLVTGVTALIGDGPQRSAVAMLDRASGMRFVDPNLRPKLWGSDRARELIMPLVEHCDALLGGEAELAALVGKSDGPDGLHTLAERCRAIGPSEVVIKRGPAGAAVLDADDHWSEHAEPVVQELDPVGAGDAFNAAYVHARLAGASPAQALPEGTRAGSASAASFGDTTPPASIRADA